MKSVEKVLNFRSVRVIIILVRGLSRFVACSITDCSSAKPEDALKAKVQEILL